MKNKSYELVNFCEVDKFAIKSYCAIHNVDENLNLGDITKVNETNLKPFNMICGGSPCQDFSVTGKKQGSKWKCTDCGHEYNPLTVHYLKRHQCPNCNSENLDKTRSSLLIEWLRIIRANKPKWGIYENVKNIVGKQFKETFQMFLNELHEYGYNTYYQVLNAKDYGVPQNRERVYLIIVLKEFDNHMFNFPGPFDNGLKLSDILESEVDEKYYVDVEKNKTIIDELISSGKLNKEFSNAIRVGGRGSLDRHQWDLVQIKKDIIIDDTYGYEKTNRYYDTYSPALRSGRSGLKTLTDNESLPNIFVRKLTPRECWRIMDFSDEAFDKAKKAGISDTQLYKQAGNSIVVNVLYCIFKELYKAIPYLFEDLKVGSYFSGIGAFEFALDKLFENINADK